MAKLPTIYIRIQNSERMIWEGSALALSSVNSKGPFDILPRHARFITMVKDQQPIIIHTVEALEKVFTFSKAVLYVHDDQAVIFAGI